MEVSIKGYCILYKDDKKELGRREYWKKSANLPYIPNNGEIINIIFDEDGKSHKLKVDKRDLWEDPENTFNVMITGTEIE